MVHFVNQFSRTKYYGVTSQDDRLSSQITASAEICRVRNNKFLCRRVY